MCTLIPCHCYLNFNPFEDVISYTELHLFMRGSASNVSNENHIIDEFMNIEMGQIVRIRNDRWKRFRGNGNRRVYQIRKLVTTDTHINTGKSNLWKHVVHIFFRSWFSSTRRPNTCSSSHFIIGLHHPILNICRHQERKMHTALDNDDGIFRKCDRWFDITSISVCMYRTRCDTCLFATSACTNVWLLIDLFCFVFHKAVRFSEE